MTMPVIHTRIEIIGDSELINGMRLAGLSKYHLIQKGPEADKEVRQIFTSLLSQPEVGVIIIMEDYAAYVADLISRLKQEKRLTPVIVEVPSKGGTTYGDVKQYYKAFIRKFIGFDIEI